MGHVGERLAHTGRLLGVFVALAGDQHHIGGRCLGNGQRNGGGAVGLGAHGVASDGALQNLVQDGRRVFAARVVAGHHHPVGVVLGDDRSMNEALVQSTGTAWRIATPALRQAMGASPALTAALLRYIHVFIAQASQTALANGRGKLDERLARWLLMWHDRLRDDNLTITHEFLALLLGVRRQGVTVALHDLEGKGLIKSTRSLIKILDRAGLQHAANGFYGLPEAEYDRAIGLGSRRPL